MDPQNLQNLKSKIEAFLFAHGEPINKNRLSEKLNVSVEHLSQALKLLEEDYLNHNHSLTLIYHGEDVALGTKPEFSKELQDFFGETLRQNLTQAALETLAIIAYRGPISKPEIDAIRGVNSAFMIRNLMLRGLIERIPNPERQNVWLYRITLDFMKMLGLEKIQDLPEYENLSKSLDEIQYIQVAQQENESNN
jgi:segregation and condensation protein B